MPLLRLLVLLLLPLLSLAESGVAVDNGAEMTVGVSDCAGTCVCRGDCTGLLSALGGVEVVAGCRGTCSGSEADFGSGGGVMLRGAQLGVRCTDRSVPLDFRGES